MFYVRYCQLEMKNSQNYPVVHFLLCCGCQADRPSLLRPFRRIQCKGVFGFIQNFNYNSDFIQEHMDILRQEKIKLSLRQTQMYLPQCQHFCTLGLWMRHSCQGQHRISSSWRRNGAPFPVLHYLRFILPICIKPIYEDPGQPSLALSSQSRTFWTSRRIPNFWCWWLLTGYFWHSVSIATA